VTTAVRYGLLLAVVVGIPVFWPLMSSGQMTTEAALTRGAVLVGGCVFGVYLVTYLVDSYTRQQAQARRRAAMADRLERALQQQRDANEADRKADEPPEMS
jgi:hypothetical protein